MRAPGLVVTVVALGLLGCGQGPGQSAPPPPPPKVQPRASAALKGQFRLELGQPRARRDENTRWCYLELSSPEDGALAAKPWHPGPEHTFSCSDLRISPSGLVNMVIRREQALAQRAPDAERGEIVGREVFVNAETWTLSLYLERDAEGKAAGLKGEALVDVTLEDGAHSRFKQRLHGVPVEEGEVEAAPEQWDASRPPETPAPQHVDFASTHSGDLAPLPRAEASTRSESAAEAARKLREVRVAEKPRAAKVESATVAVVAPAPAPAVAAPPPAEPAPPNMFLLYSLLGLSALVCFPILLTLAIEARRKRIAEANRERIKVTVLTTTHKRRRLGAQEWSQRMTHMRSAPARAKRDPAREWALWGGGRKKLQIHAASESSDERPALETEADAMAVETPAGSFEYAPAPSRFRVMIDEAWASESSAENLILPARAAPAARPAQPAPPARPARPAPAARPAQPAPPRKPARNDPQPVGAAAAPEVLPPSTAAQCLQALLDG